MSKLNLVWIAAAMLLLWACATSEKPTPPPAPLVSASKPTTTPAVAVAHHRPASRPTTRPRFFRIVTLTTQPDSWFKTPEGQTCCDNIVGWQNANGGWFKNYDPHKPRPATVPDVPNLGPASDSDKIWHQVSTFDNDATHSEMRILARAYRVLGKPAYKQSFGKGLTYIFETQYPNGGFPQRYPLQDNYGRYITINDGAMLGVVSLLKDISDQSPDFTFVTPDQLSRAKNAYKRGLDCFLACQVRINGKPTIWCQQYDPVTLEPREGRTFELPALCSRESVDLLLFLMTIDHPNKPLRNSINSAMAWFEAHKTTGKAYKSIDAPDTPRGTERVLVDDPKGKPLWARFYDFKTEQPVFVGRDGIPHSSVDQISYERRNGYEWWGTWGLDAHKAYKKWKPQWDHDFDPIKLPASQQSDPLTTDDNQ